MQLHGEGQSRLLWHLTPKHCGLPEQTPLGIKTQLHGKRQSELLWHLVPKHCVLPEHSPLRPLTQVHGNRQSWSCRHLTPKQSRLPEHSPSVPPNTQLHGKRQSAVLRQLTPKHSLLPEQVPKASGTARTGAESLNEFGDAGLSSSLSAFWSASARLSGRLIHRSAVKNNRALYMPGRVVVN